MRHSTISGELERTLREYVAAAATLLRADIAAGAEVELELGAQRGRSGRGHIPLYTCRPLTERFIAEREPRLRSLPEHAMALQTLCEFDGLERYLAGREGCGESGDSRDAALLLRARDRSKIGLRDERATASARAGSALNALLEDVFAEQTDFEPSPERMAAALGRLERAELASASGSLTLVASLHGMAISSPELRLTRGLTIAVPETLRWAPEQALSDAYDDGAGHLLVALSCEEPIDGRAVLADLLRALRLFGDGRVTLGPLAWARLDGHDAWTTVPLGTGGRPHGMLVVAPEQEDELRAFCNLVSRRAPDANQLAWALRRFELGCERPDAYEGLSDHLLALRALLEPEGPASGLLCRRVAALCATPEHRARLIERMNRAQRLERAVISGTATASAAGMATAAEVSNHLRALLRDVICGHLPHDLAPLADELLAQETAPEAQAAGELAEDEGVVGDLAGDEQARAVAQAHRAESVQAQQVLVEA